MKNKAIEQIKDLIREPYAWPGGYEKFAVMNDGGLLCAECCKAHFRLIVEDTKGNYRTGWDAAGVDCAANLESADFIHEHSEFYSLDFCDQCQKVFNQ